MTPLPLLRLLAVTALGFALTLTTNTLEPAVLSHKVLALAPNLPNTALGLTTFAGLIVASLVQPLVGVLSDRTRSRWGQRLPFMVIGALVAAPCLYLIALAPDFGVVVAGVLLIQFAASAVQGPWQALIPDLVPEGQRGRAAGLKALLDILALVVGRQVAGYLVSRAPQWGDLALVAAVSVPVGVYALALAVTVWGVRTTKDEGRTTTNTRVDMEKTVVHRPPAPRLPAGSSVVSSEFNAPRSASAEAPKTSLVRALAGAFAVDWRAYPAFGWWLLNRLLFWAAFIALTTFLVFFMIDVGGLEEAEAQRYVGTLSVVLGGALVLVTLPSGWLADRLGRHPIVAAAGLIAAAGAGLLLLTHNLMVITAAGMIVGLGVGLFLSANWALVTDIVPRHEAARYLGLANIASAGGSALARLLGATLIDPVNQALGSNTAGYTLLYGLAAVLFVLSAVVVVPMKRAREKEKERGR